jgi:hypothetical protein
MLSNAAHCTPEAMINDFAQEMFTVLREVFDIYQKVHKNIFQKFLDQIFTEVENDLRLTCHACQNVSLDEVEAFFSQQKSKTKSSQSLANSDPTSLRSVRMVKLLQIPNVHIGNRIINVKG